MKKISASQMTVDSLYSPLSELVSIASVGDLPLEQWYYVTAGVYYPDHTTNPLLLRPQVTCTDPDTGQAYIIAMTISKVRWYYREYEQTAWTEITNTTESGNEPYTIRSNGDLSVRANKTVELRCDISYADPRTNNSLKTTAYQTLVTNVDADSVYSVHITSDKGGTEYSPLTENSSRKTFHAKATLGNSDVTGSVLFQWYTVIGNGQEVLFGSEGEPLTAYVSGQGTPTLVVDALYGEEIVVILRMKRNASSPLQPCRDQTVVNWRVAALTSEVYCSNGSAVKASDTGRMEFRPIFNTNVGTLDDSKVNEHLLIKWSRRNSAGAFSEVGWGPTITQDVSELRTNGQTSTLMQAEAYLKGPLAAVIHRINGVDYLVVYDNKQVIERKV